MGMIEICCFCGFVHRDDIAKIRQSKLHYHWTDGREQRAVPYPGGDVVVVPTACAVCLPTGSDYFSVIASWTRARQQTDAKYKQNQARFNASYFGDIDSFLQTHFDRMCDAISVIYSVQLTYIY